MTTTTKAEEMRGEHRVHVARAAERAGALRIERPRAPRKNAVGAAFVALRAALEAPLVLAATFAALS